MADFTDKRLREQLGRIALAHTDLSEAAASIERMLELNEFDHPLIRRSPDFKAHMVCTVISYARPFGDNDSGQDVGKRLPDSALNAFSEKERKLHRRVLKLRAEEFAHADGQAASMDLTVVETETGKYAWPISRVLRIGLSRSETEALKGMLWKVGDWLSDQLVALPRRISADRFVQP